MWFFFFMVTSNYTREQVDRIKNFEWDDKEEDTNDPQPEFEVCNNILDCVDKVSQYVLENVDLSDLQRDVYQVNIPIETHPLLLARYEESWSEYSRSRVFDLVRALFIQKMNESIWRRRIELKVRSIFPKKDAQIIVSDIDFYDEPQVDVNVKTKTLDSTQEKEVFDHYSYNYSGNTVTVELKIDIASI